MKSLQYGQKFAKKKQPASATFAEFVADSSAERTNPLFYSTISSRLKNYRPYKELFAALRRDEYPLHLRGIRGGLLSIVLAKMRERLGRAVLLVLPTEQEAETVAGDLRQFGFNALTLPWWGTVPYHAVSHNSPIFGARMKVLDGILDHSVSIVCASLRSFLAPLPPPAYIRAHYLQLHRAQPYDPQQLLQLLDARGYLRVKRVSVAGEFAFRGEVCDLFMTGDEYPVRIVFGWNEIEQIRRFDVSSQGSLEDLKEISIRPCREIIWDEEGVEKLKKNLQLLPELDKHIDEIIDNSILPRQEGHERYFPLVFTREESASIHDYLGEDSIVLIGDYERCLSAEEGLVREYEAMYRRIRHSEAVARPQHLLFSLEEREAACKCLIRLPLLAGTETVAGAKPPVTEIHLNTDAPRSFFGNINFFKEEMSNLTDAGYEVFLFADSDVQRLRLEQLFKELSITILADNISAGFSIPALSFMVIHENEVFGRKRRIPQSVRKANSAPIDSFVEMDEGDYVVHVNHGIGRFLTIERISVGENERDYIKIEYANEEYVFVPIEQVNLIQRYIGSHGSNPRMDTIGGTSWARRKSRVAHHVEEIAGQLLALYSKRKKTTGYAFPPDSEWQLEFEASFPFEETEDQIRCINEVKEDMEVAVPMDRLVCGDVGYGKTEIALRAAFKAVSAGRQVALLAPTTILAEQHYETVCKRAENFPITVGMMSRLVNRADQRKILANLAEGGVDLLIGTHRILQKDVIFKNLSLLIIDEEQRFGVKDKERLKELKVSIDCLTLSATPIPRTLHMNLLKIRDMSILKTPPHNRRPIETRVEAFNEELIAAAIRQEIARGGQIFYLHNRVETLENIRIFIQNLVPEVLVEQAHGQMNPLELEKVMRRFINGGFQVLVATTIIENGIDIPNVNTIIIDRADMYGISQLYQLRGRVGRSGQLAYAYLFYPDERALSEMAMKRLQIISDNTELGSGFKIAMKDLEVRGAGNLLGREQSGDIYSIGFDLYLKLLDQAIRRLKDEELPSEIHLEMEYSAFIPESYIQDTMAKMDVYKRIASVDTEEALNEVYAEISDRFGPPPDEVASLLSLAEIRVLCRRLDIAMLRERRGRAEVHFGKMSRLNMDRVMELIRTSGGAVKPDPKQPQVLLVDTSMVGLQEKSEYLRDRLSVLLD